MRMQMRGSPRVEMELLDLQEQSVSHLISKEREGHESECEKSLSVKERVRSQSTVF